MSSLIAPKSKHLPKVALVGLDESSNDVLRTSLQQFKIDCHVVAGDPFEALQKKKFEGVAVRLDDNAAPILEAVRNSPRNRQVTILGICSSTQEAIRYSKFGINAVLRYPLERQDTIKAVRATHMLILHELRRYVRVPIVLEIKMELAGGVRIAGVTRDISYGGMSVKVPSKISQDTYGDLSFTLPNGKAIRCGATVIWFHPPELIGIRFEQTDERRFDVRRWIDEYLEIG